MPRAEREEVMLCYSGDEGRISRLGSSVFAQPKYRGVRCRIEWFHNEPVPLSSYNTEFKYLETIKASLIKNFSGNQISFDGELYRHGWSQGRINSAALRKKNENTDTGELTYQIYDTQEREVEQWKRIHDLMASSDFIQPPLFLAETLVIETKDWLSQMNYWLGQGYEGIILRKADGLYVPKRSVSIIKVKPTEKDEYKIVGIKEAIDKNGVVKGMLGSFEVQDREGVEFKVGAGKLSHKTRTLYWQQPNLVLGKVLIVKHEPYFTDEKIPVCAVAVEVKDGNL